MPTFCRSLCPILLVLLLPTATAQNGREENVLIRSVPYQSAPIRSGPYPEGEPLPERAVDGGVEIAGHTIKTEHYEAMKRSGYVPMRRELTDAELLAALEPEFRERFDTAADFAAHARRKFSDYVPFLYWGFRRRGTGQVAWKAQETYAEQFTPEGQLKPRYLGNGSPPTVAMMRWAGSYWNTGDETWARAVRDAFKPYYHANRPPLGKVHNAKARAMWHVLGAASRTPFLIESYGYLYGSTSWTGADHVAFLKAMLERGRYLRYTSQPVGPWLEYNPFCYGNWLLYQLQGLLAIAAYFPEFREADDWLAHATRGIGRHGDWSVMQDSGFDEYSYSYADQVCGQMEYCYNTFAKNGLPLPPRFRANVLRLHELFLKLAHPAGERIPFGDTHRGASGTPNRSRWAALAFLDGRFKHFAAELPDQYLEQGARVLHPGDPEGAVRRFRALESVPPTAMSHILPEPGWVVMRSDWDRNATVVACAYRGSARVFHSGWEMGSFNLWAHGEPLLTKLLGYSSYSSGYPDGFCRTPRQANQVILKGAEMRRVAGSLRNWFSSPVFDYLHMDHRGWRDGQVTVRRRLLFLKPDWVLIIDDVEGEGSGEALWQAHTGEAEPKIDGTRAAVSHGNARATLAVVGTRWRTESHRVPGKGKTVHLLIAGKEGELPLRFVTAIHLAALDVPGPGACRPLRGEGAEGVELTNGGAVHRVQWEASPATAGRFVAWAGGDGARFFAGDGNPDGALKALLDEAEAGNRWNGRALFVDPASPARGNSMGAIDLAHVEAFAYHGRPEMTPAGTAGRVVWQTDVPARHSVLYRRAGTATWQRQFQPDLYRKAWILLPDLTPGADYDLRVESELESGQLLRSPAFVRTAPAEWSMF